MSFEPTTLTAPEAVHDTNLTGLPPTVRAAYDISRVAIVSHLETGHVNSTFVVEEEGQITIVRRLSSELGGSALRNARVVSSYLASQGWEAPVHLPTTTGDFSVRDARGEVWHQMDFIASEGAADPLASDLPANMGNLLGRWHAGTRDLEYDAQSSIEHFHDTAYYARELLCRFGAMPTVETLVLANDLLTMYGRLRGDEASGDEQIIHGDPKLDNTLSRGGSPFTLIDYDNVMIDSPWVDVGDCLRSVGGKRIDQDTFSTDVNEFVTAYHQAAELGQSVDEAANIALGATTRISLNLGMHYLVDLVDGKYFRSWDSENFKSRVEYHAAKAALQLEVARKSQKAA